MDRLSFPNLTGTPTNGARPMSYGAQPMMNSQPAPLSFGGQAPSAGPSNVPYQSMTPQLQFNLPTNAAPSAPVFSTSGGGAAAGSVGMSMGAVSADAAGGAGMTQDALQAAQNSQGWFGPDTMGKIGAISDVIGSFGKVYAGLQANKIAKDTLNFQKESYGTNLANQISSYNMALEDRGRARYAQMNGTDAEASAYINKHKLGAQT